MKNIWKLCQTQKWHGFKVKIVDEKKLSIEIKFKILFINSVKR